MTSLRSHFPCNHHELPQLPQTHCCYAESGSGARQTEVFKPTKNLAFLLIPPIPMHQQTMHHLHTVANSHRQVGICLYNESADKSKCAGCETTIYNQTQNSVHNQKTRQREVLHRTKDTLSSGRHHTPCTSLYLGTGTQGKYLTAGRKTCGPGKKCPAAGEKPVAEMPSSSQDKNNARQQTTGSL